jgi:hypothetical protein
MFKKFSPCRRRVAASAVAVPVAATPTASAAPTRHSYDQGYVTARTAMTALIPPVGSGTTATHLGAGRRRYFSAVRVDNAAAA